MKKQNKRKLEVRLRWFFVCFYVRIVYSRARSRDPISQSQRVFFPYFQTAKFSCLPTLVLVYFQTNASAKSASATKHAEVPRTPPGVRGLREATAHVATMLGAVCARRQACRSPSTYLEVSTSRYQRNKTVFEGSLSPCAATELRGRKTMMPAVSPTEPKT